ncbi:hypothetical protein D3C87_820680 [compost metagenome]
MSIKAVLLDQNMERISDDIIVKPDKFKNVEREAKIKADSGIKCCVRWSNDADGCSGYWGPSGACIEPHWYVKQGRPNELKNGMRKQIYMDQESLEVAQKLGNGNVSEGIRKALMSYASKQD